MFRTMMRAKLHRATVTEANLNYVGSITIDEDLMDAVNIVENEKVQIVNNNNGARLETYVIKGERGSGVVCLNGLCGKTCTTRGQSNYYLLWASYGRRDSYTRTKNCSTRR